MLYIAYLMLIMLCASTSIHAASSSHEIKLVSEDLAACFTEYDIEIPGPKQHYEFLAECRVYPDTVRSATPPFKLMDGIFGYAASPDAGMATALAAATATEIKKLYGNNNGTADFVYEDWSIKASQQLDKAIPIALRKASSVHVCGFKSVSVSRPQIWLLGLTAEDLCMQPLLVPRNMMPLMRDIRYVHGTRASMHERLATLEEHAKELCEDAAVKHTAQVALLDLDKFQKLVIQKLTYWKKMKRKGH